MNDTYVAVIGPGEPDESAETTAFGIGGILAAHGFKVVTGGLGGSMEACCRGAKMAGGTTIGILPGASRSEANQYVDIAIPTGMGEARNALVVGASDGVIAVGGGYGTLSEIALALKAAKPIVGVGTWNASVENREIEMVRAADPDEAVRLLVELIERRPAT